MTSASRPPLQIFAPASIGNVAVGFDLLGAALQTTSGEPWGDVVSVQAAETARFSASGPFAHKLPASADNLVLHAARAVAALLGKPLPPLAISLHKGLPVGSGLGSSSASAVAGAVAVGAWLDGVDAADLQAWKANKSDLLLDAAGQAEAVASGAHHLDNVAPCLLGGLQLTTPLGQRRLPWPDDLLLVLASPPFSVATKDARAVLPTAVPMAVTIAHAEYLAASIVALYTADRPLLQASIRDLLAEPHRAVLVPGFVAAKALALEAGALACSLGGAGPAVFALGTAADAPAIAAALAAGFASAGHQADVRICALDSVGARAI
jgi:homoserine kinase